MENTQWEIVLRREPDSSLVSAATTAPLGMALKRYRAGGSGERIGYAVAPAPLDLGLALLAVTERGLCAVLLGSAAAGLAAELKERFPSAVLVENPALAERFPAVFALETVAETELPLDLRATAFQARVWAALRAIPGGETRTYAQVAAALGNSKAVRAVARACAQNLLAVVVPCHRVVGSNGSLTGYRWGLERKQALLDWERRRNPGP